MTPEQRAREAIATAARQESERIQTTMTAWAEGEGPMHHASIHETFTSVVAAAIRAAIADEREACANVAESEFPRGGAYTYASENADRYLALEDAGEEIAAAIRARA